MPEHALTAVPPPSGPRRFRPALLATLAALAAAAAQPHLPGAQDYISGKGIVPVWAPWAGAALGIAVSLAGLLDRLPRRGGGRRAALAAAWTAVVLLLWSAVGLVFDLFRGFFWATGIPAGDFATVDWPGFLTRLTAFAATVLLGREARNSGRATRGDHLRDGAARRFDDRYGYLAAGLAVPYPLVKYYWWAGGRVGRPEPYTQGFPVLETLLLVGGVVLALALVRPWGRVFPSWTPFLAGRRVDRRICLAAGWGLSAALALQGLIPLFATLNHLLGGPPPPFDFTGADSWLILTVYAGWGLFGLTLAGATRAYQRQTRPGHARRSSGPVGRSR